MQEGQEFRFINNEPTHKENLSGRVTAACLNCRRKKIKCSGEVHCKQCQAKGVVCEGPPSRKRPNRENVASSNEEGPSVPAHVDKSSSRSNVSSSTGDASNNQTSRSVSLLDPGCASYGRESRSSFGPSTSASPAKPQENEVAAPGRAIRPLPARRTLQHILPAWDHRQGGVSPSSNASEECSPFAFTQNWVYGHGPNMSFPPTPSSNEWSPVGHGPPLNTSLASHVMLEPTQGELAPMSAATISSESMSTRSQHGLETAWRPNIPLLTPPDHLIHAAEALEEQAPSLRELAFRRGSLDTSAYELQQQLVPQSQQMLNFSGPNDPDQMIFGAFSAELSYPPYQFDSSTLSTPDATLGTVSTGATDGYGLWDLDSHPQPPPLPVAGGSGGLGISPGYYQYDDFEQQQPAPLPLPTKYRRSNQGLASSGGSLNARGLARMQRLFHAQLGVP